MTPHDTTRTTSYQNTGNMTEEEKQQVPEATTQVKQKVGEVTAEVKERLEAVAEQAKTQVQQTTGEAEAALSQSKSQTAERLGSVSHVLRQTSQNLRDENEQGIARYTEQAADQVEHFANYLQQRTVDDILHDLEDFGRRQPELFLGGALALGVAAGRFLRSSSPVRRRQPYGPSGFERRYYVQPYGRGYAPPSPDASSRYAGYGSQEER